MGSFCSIFRDHNWIISVGMEQRISKSIWKMAWEERRHNFWQSGLGSIAWGCRMERWIEADAGGRFFI